MRSNPAYTAAAVKLPTAGADSYSNGIVVSYGDITIQGNATEDTVEAFRAALRENTDYIQELVYNQTGMKKIEKRFTVQENHMITIARRLLRP